MNNDVEIQKNTSFGKLLIKKSLKYGLLANILVILGLIVFYFLFDNVITSTRNLAIFLVLIFMFFAVREFRSENNNNLMFYQGVFVGLSTFIVFAIVSGLILYLYSAYIDPQALIIYVDYKLESLIEYKEMIGEEEYTQYFENTKSLTPFDVAMDHVFTQLYIGVFGSAIVAAILRKTPEAV